MNSLQGQLLLDGGKLTGSEFHHTVVLICRHDPDGAFGLVLNKASEHTVAESLIEKLPEAMQELPVFLGGPVNPQALSCLIYEPAIIVMTEAHILPGLRLTHDLDELLEPSGSFAPATQLKFFAGYAGWSAGQLDNEMKRNDWLTHPACIDFIFNSKPTELWKTILRGKGPKYRLLAETPDDISQN
jgi:putative transcriptional regulator